MLKRHFLSLALLLASLAMGAQNLQLHYDFRHALNGNIPATNYFTSTFEYFKPDKWGSTFLFVDMDYNQSRGNIGTAYWEIARDIKIGKYALMPHIEYNGGAGNSEGFGFSIANAYLLGASYSFGTAKTHFNTYLAYKYNAFQKVSNDVQWTLSWGSSLCNNKITLSGFTDVWTENKDRKGVKSGKKIILLTEPQIWYNVNSNVSIGSEIEISNNFYTSSGYNNRLYVFPTLAGKWTF